MINLTFKSINRLSVHVMNTEYLYSLKNDFKLLSHAINTLFIYTPEQLEALKKDISEDSIN
jgi:hypothetical protein